MSQESKLYQAATELGEALAQDEEFLIQIDEITSNRKPDLETKLKHVKEAVLAEQETFNPNPQVLVKLLEKLMILQSLNEKPTYSTAETLRHFQGKLDKQKWDDPKPPNIALYLFWQVWAAIAYFAITIGLLLIAYVPAANYCQRRESPFCTGIQNMRTYVVGESKPTNLK